MHQGRLLAAFNALNLMFEIILVTKYILNHDDIDQQYINFAKKEHWGDDTFTFAALISSMIVYNMFVLLFGVFVISKHRKYLHYTFAWLLAFSVLFESVITIFSLANLLAVIPRILLLLYQHFVANKLLPPAVEMPEPERSKLNSEPHQNQQYLLGNSFSNDTDEQQGKPKPPGRDARVAGEYQSWNGMTKASEPRRKKDVFTKRYMEVLEKQNDKNRRY